MRKYCVKTFQTLFLFSLVFYSHAKLDCSEITSGMHMKDMNKIIETCQKKLKITFPEPPIITEDDIPSDRRRTIEDDTMDKNDGQTSDNNTEDKDKWLMKSEKMKSHNVVARRTQAFTGSSINFFDFAGTDVAAYRTYRQAPTRFKREERPDKKKGRRHKHKASEERDYDSSEENYVKYNKRSRRRGKKTQECELQYCLYRNMNMTNVNGLPDKDRWNEFMIKPIKNVDLKQFLVKIVNECFEINNDHTIDKCILIDDLTQCLSEKMANSCDIVKVKPMNF